jgi:atypical dual specificity phosphatase
MREVLEKLNNMKKYVRQIAPITDYLYLCGGSAVKKDRLLELGITCVLNVAIELDKVYLDCTHIQYIKYPVHDTCEENIKPYLDLCADKIYRVRQSGGRTLVHCVAGASRSATVCLAYLMKYRQYTLKNAYHLVKSKRPVIYPNIGFWRILIEYEKRLYGVNSVTMVNYSGLEVPSILQLENGQNGLCSCRLTWETKLILLLMIPLAVTVMGALFIIKPFS